MPDRLWLKVGETSTRTGGWKLHVSAVPADVEPALEAIAPVVRTHGAPFKICRTDSALHALNSGELGESQVGKFCTIYPENDQAAVEIAAELVARTREIRGPVVPSDLALGAAVYARYGSFSPIFRTDRLGTPHAWIHLPDGRLVEDERTVPFHEPDGAPNPFGSSVAREPEARDLPSGLGPPGYRCIDLIRRRTTGSVFLALDPRDPRGRSPWRALKQARAHTFSDTWGRDRRDRLRHEERVLHRLAGVAGVPLCDEYFDDSGDGYLAVDFVRGSRLLERSVRQLGGRPLGSLDVPHRKGLIESGIELIRVVASVHERGFLHRDLSANNVLIGGEGDVHLIDFELAYELGSDTPPFFTGTPGFMTESQLEHRSPRIADDVYGVAACLVALLCGVDPRLLVGGEAGSTASRLQAWSGGGDTRCWELIGAFLDQPSDTPPWRDLERCLARLGPPGATVRPARRAGIAPEDAAARALGGLAAPELLSEDGLPLSIESGGPDARYDVEEIAAHAHRGIAGVLYLIALGARLGIRDPRTDRLALVCIRWLLARDPSPAEHLPGLFFGRAGWAVALDDAVESGVLDPPDRWDDLLQSLLDGPLDWYDLTHGLAGQGLAALRLARGPQRAEMLARAAECASLLVDAQEPDGSWRAAQGVPGLSGEVLPGFAHGVAGIVYFLATADRALPDPELAGSWRSGVDWLLGNAVEDPDGSLQWRYSSAQRAVWRWWCHGAPGIALALLRAFEVGGEDAHAAAAARALASVSADVRHANLTQCHGLAGLGQILLEGWRVLGDDALLRRASSIAEMLVETAHETRSGDLVWFAESFLRPTGDLMQGGGGVVHLLLCLSRLDVRVSPPLLLTLDDVDGARAGSTAASPPA